ncbi:MAG: peptidase domain-containing ABC transporter [Fischerella sp.]|uniref:peptidase domain-containing ABC transporter n=1 Tax=Fischerella sp. TaxID=1191 RepID=UPI0017F1102F|nr:peptidase domain-containing ABC transporter [Fischerella sp.]NWF58244.1 peptidase domain-containing ABC transporter [Fischerella sp.]
MPSVFDQQQLGQRLTEILGEKLANQELQSCIKATEILKPPVAKLFWQATSGKSGIYLVLVGKVRLLDSSNNLITTLNAGASFGEMTLFAQQEWLPYAARASANLQLAYLPDEVLHTLMDKYPPIGDRLRKKAEIWDLMLALLPQQQDKSTTSCEEILKALSLFRRHSLELGSLYATLRQDSKLWLLHRGELQSPDGSRLTPGNLCEISRQGDWQVTQPTTIAYTLSHADWETALQSWPDLAQLINSEPTSATTEAPTNGRTVIPFPQPEPSPAPKSKKRRSYFPNPQVKIGQVWGHITQRYPFYAQQSASDCGAACLVMISRYWGKRFSISLLRDLANTNRSGASIKGLVAAAESIGFSTRPVKASLEKLAEQPLPAIAHWEGKHYIVVYEITKKRVIICDPAIGQRSLTHKQFNAGWTGYALLLQPTAGLKETPEATQPFWQFFDLIKPHTQVLLEVVVASVLIQLFGLVTPLFTQLLLDRVVVQGSTLTLNAVGLGLIIFGLFRVAMSGLRQYLLDHTANRIGVALMVGFIKHTFRLPLAFFESRYVGDIVSRVQENQKIQRFLAGEALSTTLDLVTVFIYIGLMFWYSWQLALLVLLVVPPFVLLAAIATPFLRLISREIFNTLAKESSYLIESLTGIRTIRSMAIEQTVRWRWEELLNQAVKKNFSGQVIGVRLQVFSTTIETLATTVLLWFGAWQVIQNQLTIGQLVAFNMLLGQVIRPFQRLVVLWNELQEIVISTERINDVLQAEPEEDLQTSPKQFIPKLHGSIRFVAVTFRYHPESDRNVLENLSFEIKPEQTVAVVGRSGSGKTTLSKLLLGLYPPTDGKILIDGQDVTTLSLRSLRQQIGVVDQDTFLFGGTIRENLSIAHPQATLEEITQAATIAGADEFIRQLPMGYETQIGEGGGLLSGGQRQRLAIARALVGNPRLLIFDEATSHLDSESERIIQNNLKTILTGRTSIIIAHRLSTIRNADLILVLDRGVLIESGNHDELIKAKGHYFYLNQQQLAQVG